MPKNLPVTFTVPKSLPPKILPPKNLTTAFSANENPAIFITWLERMVLHRYTIVSNNLAINMVGFSTAEKDAGISFGDRIFGGRFFRVEKVTGRCFGTKENIAVNF